MHVRLYGCCCVGYVGRVGCAAGCVNCVSWVGLGCVGCVGGIACAVVWVEMDVEPRQLSFHFHNIWPSRKPRA